jgi:hypothetical protein
MSQSHLPANLRPLRREDGELPAYLTTDQRHAVIYLNGKWFLFRRAPGGFATRSDAAAHVASGWARGGPGGPGMPATGGAGTGGPYADPRPSYHPPGSPPTLTRASMRWPASTATPTTPARRIGRRGWTLPYVGKGVGTASTTR